MTSATLSLPSLQTSPRLRLVLNDLAGVSAMALGSVAMAGALWFAAAAPGFACDHASTLHPVTLQARAATSAPSAAPHRAG